MLGPPHEGSVTVAYQEFDVDECTQHRLARGLGVGQAMGEHCHDEARRQGFRAMQFNFVVSTNESAVRLWRRLEFEIVGTLPGVFRHAQKGYVDAYVMYRSLERT